MKWWADFAETLNTRGGTIAALCLANLLLGGGLIFIMVRGDSNQAATVLISTFSSFTGALLLALTQKEKPNGNGNGNGNSDGSGGPPKP